MALMRWDPFADFDRMLEMVSGRGAGGNAQPGARAMPMDVYRSGDEYVVEMDLPGVEPSSIDVSVERNVLTVEAEAHSTHEEADEQILCERRHAKYRRQLYLGEDVDTDNVKAEFDNGVLRLRVPIVQEQLTRKIEVATTGNGKRRISGESSETRSSTSERQPAHTGS
jgi:HSP20 family protein